MAVVVGYVATPEGRAALRRAAEESLRRQTRLVIVKSGRGRSPEPQEAEAYEAELGRVRLEVESGGVACDVHDAAEAAEPADELLAVAEKQAADVIVIGLRRRTPVGKLILGTNAQRILLDSPCPVLAVKAEAPSTL